MVGCESRRSLTLDRTQFIDKDGVGTRQFFTFTDAASGFQSKGGVTYRAAGWVLVDVEIIRLPGHPPWRPTGATLTSKTGEARVRAVKGAPEENQGDSG